MTDPATPSRPNYKKTLNLPRTSFGMKANLVQNEPASEKRWAKTRLYERLLDARRDADPFVFHDGPPYANGAIHLGHLLNKCLKDFVVRSNFMAGRRCPYIPGWDCHGLPIEHKVQTAAIESGKMAKLESLDPDARRTAIRRDCRAYAEKFIRLQTGQMKRLLTLADYEHPYLTMAPEYEAATLEVFAELVAQGLVYRRLKAVHWSVENRTALAEAELEYHDRTDPSVFVEFDAADARAVERAFGLGEGALDRTPTFMIWTTTPWTLPANLLIAVHPAHPYALAEIDGTVTIIAEALLSKVARAAGAQAVRTLSIAPGERLIGLRYRHPFHPDADAHRAAIDPENTTAGEIFRVVGADYVTLDDGTGLVHTAPGHGHDDYQTGLREHVPIHCPVREDGTYDDTAPEFVRGMGIWEANAVIAGALRESGRLFHEMEITHSYPHDWRGRSPVIFRATEQWFIGVDTPTARDGRSLRELALDAVGSIEFVPDWGRNRMRGMLQTRPDWCLSRQRAWGLPIPAFMTPAGEPLLTAQSVRAVARVVREHGSDCWLTMSPADLLAGYDPAADPDAPRGLDTATLTKMHDIFDVWFESGSSWRAVMVERGLAHPDPPPVDLYLEGSDQHRGWFQVSLLTGLGAAGCAPYRALLTHGFMVDKDGKKMSKSLGNTLDVDDLLKRFGADVARWWVASLNYETDIKVDLTYFETAGEAYRKIRNTLRFMLSNLDDFVPSPPGKDASCGEGMCLNLSTLEPTAPEAWVLARFNALSRAVQDAYARYDFRAASTALFNFCNETLSAVYLAAVKDRLYCDEPGSARRRRTQNALWELTDGLCRLLAPILPHTADEAWRALRRSTDDDATVHLTTYLPDLPVSADDAWPDVMRVREQALAALERVRATGGVENPLDAGLTLPDPAGVLARFNPVDLADLCGVSRVSLDPNVTEPDVLDLRAEPRCERSWKRDGTVRERADGGMLSDRDARAVGVA
ncbi:MAG: isoleucine--tRNA ligase [Planctomycetota bacterium]|nr:MAG: isoleucine--tRNA ligase [Planctomycetota bacterium]